MIERSLMALAGLMETGGRRWATALLSRELRILHALFEAEPVS